MTKADISKVVDTAFDSALSEIQGLVNMELYPAAFANEYSWLRVKRIFELHNVAMRKAVKIALTELLID